MSGKRDGEGLFWDLGRKHERRTTKGESAISTRPVAYSSPPSPSFFHPPERTEITSTTTPTASPSLKPPLIPASRSTPHPSIAQPSFSSQVPLTTTSISPSPGVLPSQKFLSQGVFSDDRNEIQTSGVARRKANNVVV